MMQTIKKWAFLLGAFLLLPAWLSAQNNLKEISGKVLDQMGQPIEGAEISGKEGAISMRTNAEGLFVIRVDPADALLIEADGYASRRVAVSSVVAGEQIALEALDFHLTEKDEVQLPFGTMKKRRITGGVTAIDPKEILTYDNEQLFGGVLNSRVPGLFGGSNIRGLGDALVVVDGIPRSAGSLNLQEIDQISVLRGISARMLYGAQADKGVIMVTTKRGKAFKRTMNITGETGTLDPISFPDYLGAADYMGLYNEALVNDGQDPLYNQQQIQATRNGTDRVLYPDEDFYNSTYLKDRAAFQKLIMESSGGNQAAQYYVNLGWNRIGTLLNLGEGAEENTDRINLRGNVDYQLNDWLKMSLDGIALIDITRGPRYSNFDGQNNTADDFWSISTGIWPNAYPTLIPAGRLEDSGLLPSAVLVGGDRVLGGTSNAQFSEVNLYGELTRNGFQVNTNRVVQINTGLDFDLGGIARGLTAKAYLSFDFINSFIRQQENAYAIYQPVLGMDTTGNQVVAYNKIGVDEKRDDQTIPNGNIGFNRRLGLYGVLDYDRTYDNDNSLKITGVAYRDQFEELGVLQTAKNLHFGLRGNYMIQNKYIVEATGVYAGSPRFTGDQQFAFSPSLGLGWVLTEEPFLASSSLFQYLKLNASWGILNTDQGVNNYYLYRTSYVEPSANFDRIYDYNNEVSSNNALNIVTGNPNIGWVKRREINFGLEALLGKSLWLEANYFNTESYDQITKLTSTYPSVLGGEDFTPFENFEAYSDQGVELGLQLNQGRGDFRYSIGANFVYAEPTAAEVNEPDALLAYRKREGQPTDGMFAYVAEGLFRDQADIDNHALQTFGAVQPGDIKYQDLNGDGIINQNDQQLIGNSRSRFQYGLNIRLGFKNLDLFVQGIGQTGAERYFNDPYYWVFGNRKYSTEVLGRWTPETAGTATYPRLSSTSNPNNFRNSTFWLYEDNWFNLRRVQLTYALPLEVNGIKKVSIYLRGANLLTVSKIREKRELNIGSTPQTRSFAVGLNASF
ncbi:SusC/RagA family TonB-linked outer membrane protein [Flavilitoribacter nigricans]|uniref:TonB-dependent receptor plug domain-containing protein n=1 Tax=Flavilitoribacter nigricans (strain ATCC 23147 / DSM 23189 / NBRC 102662 / NCIMB 1420 / SS-2) TaxID=1122177 RepID=A0A2D0N1W9_FLAN2|nr:SusC/RagA family TonB-linked outer membrane protein [Flavilitoribacter nigricans]PHN02129.1 hypothetical protein CRP01_33610 [Flavilitoribacter nigricans DSM 23189 = NBRC 102662]